MFTVLAVFGLGGAELIVVGLVVLLLFGSRLPSVMRSLGQSVTSFKTGLDDENDEEKKRKESLDEKNK